MIDVTSTNGVWRLTLNNPDKANALSMGMLADLRDAAKAAHTDTALKAVILTGAGERVFCAGADLGDSDDLHAMTRNPLWKEASDALANLPCLTIAALNGTVAGGGFGPALACDIRIATPQTKFFYPVLKRQLLPQPDDVKRLTALIGSARAKMILLAGQKLTADQALNYGLVEQIVPFENFEDVLDALTHDALNAPLENSAAIKKMFWVESDDLEDCYRAAYDKHPDAIDRLLKS